MDGDVHSVRLRIATNAASDEVDEGPPAAVLEGMSRYPTEALRGTTPAALAWLSGSWVGRNGNDRTEEHWAPVAGNSLVGTFRWVKDDAVLFYELLALEQEGDQVLLRIKHFHPKLVGWEERDRAAEWLLVHLAGREAAFLELDAPVVRWAVYRRETDERLVSYFATETEAITDTGLFAYARS